MNMLAQKYSSHSNEFIDEITKTISDYNKIKNRIPKGKRDFNAERCMEENWKPFCEKIKNSVKFKLSGANFFLRDGDNPFDLLKKFVDEVNLPYPTVVFEIDAFVTLDCQNAPTIILLEQVDDLIFMCLAIKGVNWNIVEINGKSMKMIFNRKTLDLKMDLPSDQLTDEQKQGIANNYFSVVFGLFVSFICALSCKNTKIEDSSIQQSSVKNSIRKSKGKLPFFTHKILTIDGAGSEKKNPNGGSHASPRVHLRRGHIRRLENKNVWVNSCVVGDKSKGMVSKDYTVDSQLLKVGAV